MGAGGKRVRQDYSHDAFTGQLLVAQVDTENQATADTWDDKFTTSYGYDLAGNVTVVSGKTSGVRDQVECFEYDYLRRLTEAWTNATWNCTSAPVPGGSGADAYWRQWTFDAGWQPHDPGRQDRDRRHDLDLCLSGSGGGEAACRHRGDGEWCGGPAGQELHLRQRRQHHLPHHGGRQPAGADLAAVSRWRCR